MTVSPFLIFPDKTRYPEEIINLANEEFGYGYLTKDTLRQFLLSPTSLCLILQINNCFGGYSLVKLCEPDELETLFDKNSFALFSSHKKLGYRFQTVIKNQYTRQGYGDKLIEAGNSWLLEQGAEALVAAIWLKDKKTTASVVLEKKGFVRSSVLPDFWRERSLKENFNCKICGQPPCRCSAALYIKTLHRLKSSKLIAWNFSPGKRKNF